jgi:prophage antirepressor-like protein
MEHSIITNQELGHAYFYWESKHGRLFLAKQIMFELGYKGVGDTLRSYELIDGHDFIKFTKKNDPFLFKELFDLKSIGQRASEIIMLTESGFWKLLMQSRKSVGVKTRHWLASEVLPSIRKTGVYSIANNSPLAIFTERGKQLELSKAVNAQIGKTTEEYSKFWNDLHKMVVGLDAKGIKNLYQSKTSAKEVLRKHLPHLEATEAVIEDIWKQGVGLEKIKDSNLHKSLAHSFNAILSLGIDLKNLGK